MLFDLPTELVTSILLQWVNVRVLHHLDSACCNTALREQLLKIFSDEHFIVRVGMVSSKHDGASLSWLTKRKLKLPQIAMHTYVEVEGLIRHYTAVGGRHVRRVHLISIPRVNDVLETFSTYCSEVSRWFIQDVVGPVTVTGFLTACGANVVSIFFDNFTLDITSKSADLHLPNLRNLYLNCTSDAGVLRAFLSASARFEQVRVMRVPVDDVAADLLCSSAASLLGLGIEDCRAVTHDSWQRLAKCCPNLRLIQLQQCGPFNEAGVAALIGCSVHLESVLLNGSLGNQSLLTIAENCGPQLRHLSLGGLICQDDSGIDALAAKCCHIVSLRCRVSGVSIAALARLVSAQTALCELSFALASIDDTVLDATLKHAPSLTYLDLYHAAGYMPSTLIDIVTQLAALEILCVVFDADVCYVLRELRTDLELKHRFASPPFWRKERWVTE
jgi:hypothetical protein